MCYTISVDSVIPTGNAIFSDLKVRRVYFFAFAYGIVFKNFTSNYIIYV